MNWLPPPIGPLDDEKIEGTASTGESNETSENTQHAYSTILKGKFSTRYISIQRKLLLLRYDVALLIWNQF
jgi:hypothetical protein